MHAAELELSSAELTSGGSLLFEHLLLMCVGVANLNYVLLSAWLGDRSIVELLDDILTDIPGLKAV